MSRSLHAFIGAAIAIVWLSCAFAIAGGARPAPPNGWHIPDAAASERNPLALSAGDLAKGRSLYRAKCQSCHGADGNGHGPDADPDHPAGDLTDGHAAARNPDGVLFYKIWNGRAKPKMAAMKLDLTPDDVWRLVAYVKTLRR